jgi:hypothetical protein
MIIGLRSPAPLAGRNVHLLVIVRLIVAAILEVLGPGVEGQEPLEQPIVDGQRDQGPAGGVTVTQVAVLKQVVEDVRASLPGSSGSGTTVIGACPSVAAEVCRFNLGQDR